MNRKNVSDATPPLHPTHKTGNLPFVKFSSIGDKVFEKYSPIVKGEQAVSKKNPPPLARQKRNPWTKAVSQASTLSSSSVETINQLVFVSYIY